ncbi:MAG: hypothetical protein AAFY48_01830 [Bacteroidota bacterium]
MNRPVRYLLFGLLLAWSGLSAQVRVDINLDSTIMLIGDQLGVSLSFFLPEGVAISEIKYDEWAASGQAEILETSPLNTIKQGPPTLMEQRLLLTTFDSGYHKFQPLEVVYVQDGVRDTAYSSDLAMTVATIPVTRESQIRDNKDIIEEQINWLDALPYFIGLVLLGLLVLLGRQLFSKKKTTVVEPPPPPRPAHEIALEQLDYLEADAAWQRGEIKAFQSDLTFTLRSYLENRFEIQALEATTPEITRALAKQQLDEDGTIRSVLEIADMVKFAKAEPEMSAHPAALETVRNFVLTTREPDPDPNDSEEENEAEE